MKEIVASAAALAGLITFAYVSQQPEATRAKRASIEIDQTREEHDGTMTNSMASFENITMEQAADIWADLTGEDVDVKQYVKSKMRWNDAKQYHTALNTAFTRRWGQGANKLNSVGPRHGNCEDAKFIKNADCDCANAPQSCFNYAQNNRADEYLDSYGYSANTRGSEVFTGNDGLGAVNAFYYVVPRAIPLNSVDEDDHITNYNQYLQGFYAMKDNGHLTNNMYVSYVIWQNGAAAAPKNLKYRGSLPTSRMNRFWSNPGTLTNQPFLVKSLSVFAGSILGRFMHSSPDNTVSGSRNCYILWFHQDMPADINKFVNGGVGDSAMGGDEKSHETFSRCTVAHAWVLPDYDNWSGSSNKGEIVRKATAAMMGSDKVGVSDDFSGRFILNSYDEISSDAFHVRVMRYFAAAKRRRLCQLNGNLWQPAEDGSDLFGTEGTANPYDYADGETEVYTATASPQENYEPLEDETYANPELEVADDAYDYADMDLLSAVDDGAEAAPPTVDRCCGHGVSSLAFASTGEKSCCVDPSDSLGLSPFLTTGGCGM